MKIVYAFLISIFIYSCTNSDDNNATIEKWNLVNVSGGFAGIDVDIEKGKIIWTLNEHDSILDIENNYEGNFVISLSTGRYSYFIEEINNTSYITIDNDEYGGIDISVNHLVIDENKSSTGTGADRFVFQFEK